MTNEEIAALIAKQAEEANQKNIEIVWAKETDAGAFKVVFNFVDANDDQIELDHIPAVIWPIDKVYHRAICYTPYDWQTNCEYKDDDFDWCAIEWYDHEHKRDCIMSEGLPKSSRKLWI